MASDSSCASLEDSLCSLDDASAFSAASVDSRSHQKVDFTIDFTIDFDDALSFGSSKRQRISKEQDCLNPATAALEEALSAQAFALQEQFEYSLSAALDWEVPMKKKHHHHKMTSHASICKPLSKVDDVTRGLSRMTTVTSA